MRPSILLHLALVFLMAWVPLVRADTVAARAAELRLEEDHYVLDADFDLALNATLEEAIMRGVPLYFVVEFELQRPRWYWIDDTVVSNSLSYRLSYNALTRQYRLSSGGAFYQNLPTLEEAQRLISRVRGRSVIDKSALFKGVRYEAAVRLRLDTTQLPKPFQISALTSRDWSLQSDWVRWSFTP
jgi:Domain of unknown function (DUF4390)